MKQKLKILETVSRECDVSSSDIMGNSRMEKINEARKIFILLLREREKLSFPAIGKFLNKDHTSIIHSYYKVIEDIDNNEIFKNKVDEIIHKVKEDEESNKKESQRGSVAEIKQEKKDKPSPRYSTELLKTSLSINLSEREEKIFTMFQQGFTLEKTGKEFGLTRERVRQVLHKVFLKNLKKKTKEGGLCVDIEEYVRAEKSLARKKRGKKKESKKKEKRWSRYYLRCRKCGTISVPHVKKGYCEICSRRIRGKRREKIISMQNRKCKSCKITREESFVTFKRDFYITKIFSDGELVALCRGCFSKKAGGKSGKTGRFFD